MRVKALDLELIDPPAPPTHSTSKKAASNEPFHVARGVEIEDSPITLLDTTPSAAVPVRAAPATPASARAVTPQFAARTGVNTTPKTMPPADLDSTQTIRALTSAELDDDAQEKYFAIQLAASEHPVNLDTMPHLDIFEAYRLYSIATAGSGKIVHSLRLGFFKEAVSAEAVCGYLKTFFGAPSVLRVSIAEFTRFKDSTPLRRAAPESAKVIDLEQRAPRAAPSVPTVTMEVPTPRSETPAAPRLNDTGMFKRTGAFATSQTGSQRTLTPLAGGVVKSTKSGSGKYRTLPKKSLSEQLLEEARQVELSESGVRKLPKSASLLSKLLGK